MKDTYDELKSADAAEEAVTGEKGSVTARVAKTMATPILSAGLLASPVARKAIITIARNADLEPRSRTFWALSRKAQEAHPEIAPVLANGEAIINTLHKAEGQHFSYDDLGADRRVDQEHYGYFPSSWNAALNAKLEGLDVDFSTLPEVPGHSKQDLVNAFDRVSGLQKQQAVDLNVHERRTGAGKGEHPVTEQGYHPKTLSIEEAASNHAKNIWNALSGKHAGLTESNRLNIETAIDGYIEGNSRWDGAKVVWDEGRDRGWWKPENQSDPVRGKPSSTTGERINPDNIKTEAEYLDWKAKEPARLADELIIYKTKLNSGDVTPGERERYDRVLPYLGDVAHNVHINDIFAAIENVERNINALKSIPDDFFSGKDGKLGKIDQFKADIKQVQANLKDMADAGDPKAIDTIKDIEDMMFMLGDAPVFGTIMGDLKATIGAGPMMQSGPFGTWLNNTLDATSGPVLNLLLKINPETGLRQEVQAPIAAFAAHPSRVLSGGINRLRASPAAKYIDKFTGSNLSLDVMRKGTAYNNPIIDAGASQIQTLGKSTEQMQAAVVETATNAFIKSFYKPGPHQKFFQRMFDAETMGQIEAAIASGDKREIQNLIRPLLIRELDMVNGSDVQTSRMNLFKSSVLGKEFGRLIGTPLGVTSSVVGGKDRYGAASVTDRTGYTGDFIRGAAKLGAVGALGTQLFANAAMTMSPLGKATAAAAVGSPLLATFYFLRGIDEGAPESNTEAPARAKFQTAVSMAERGDPNLLKAMAYEALPVKLNSSGDVLTEARGSIDNSIGNTSRIGSGGYADLLTAFSPTAGTIASLGGAAKDLYDGNGMRLLSEGSPIPALRQLMPAQIPATVQIKEQNPLSSTQDANTNAMRKKMGTIKIPVPNSGGFLQRMFDF